MESSPSTSNRTSNNAENKKRSKNSGNMPPRRPLSAYNLFFRDERTRIMSKFELGERQEDFDVERQGSGQFKKNEQQPGDAKKYHSKVFQKVARTIASRWKALNGPERKKYEELAKEEMKDYRRKVQEYKKNFLESATRAARQSTVSSSHMPILSPSANQSPNEEGSLPTQSLSTNRMSALRSSVSLRTEETPPHNVASAASSRFASMPPAVMQRDLPPLDHSAQRDLPRPSNATTPSAVPSHNSRLVASMSPETSMFHNNMLRLPRPPQNSSLATLPSMNPLESNNLGSSSTSQPNVAHRLAVLRRAMEGLGGHGGGDGGRGLHRPPPGAMRAERMAREQQRLREEMALSQELRFQQRQQEIWQQQQQQQLQQQRERLEYEGRVRLQQQQQLMGQSTAAYESPFTFSEPTSPSMSLREALRLYMMDRRRS